jgi:hypothetical protein
MTTAPASVSSPLVQNVRYGYGLGWSFTPLAGKRPTLKSWQDRPRETLEQALAWAAKGNVGLRTGRVSGVVAVDVDPGADVSDLNLPGTVTALTGRPGAYHLYYLCDGPLGNSSGKLGPRIDLRADGGQVVFPGSVHPETGALYTWAEGYEPWNVEIAPLPAHILEQLQAPEKPKPDPQAAADQQPGQPEAPLQLHDDDRVSRCLATMLAMEIADGKDGSRRLFAAACRCVEHDLSVAEALVCLKAHGALKPYPTKWSTQDLLKRLHDAEERAERGIAIRNAGTVRPAYRTVTELLADYPELRRPVVHGLLREGETMNVIAPSKTGKRWLTIDLALAIATGRPWLGTYQTAKGKVLILDNELHGETSANRIPKVADARLIRLTEIADRVCVENMRGRLVDLLQLESYFDAVQPGEFKLVILDAFYRFVPKDTDENDNGTVAQLYNHIDRYAQRLGCCFVLIHHSTKGNQSAKAITDVGAGAGSQSRATDTHLILRPHQQDGVVVLDAAVRSWPPIAPMCLEWVYPVWNPVAGLNPADLRTDRRPRKSKEEPLVPRAPEWDTDTFVKTCVSDEGRVKDVVLEAATRNGVSKVRARTLLRLAEAEGKVHRWVAGANKPVRFATTPQPLIEAPKRRRAPT